MSTETVAAGAAVQNHGECSSHRVSTATAKAGRSVVVKSSGKAGNRCIPGQESGRGCRPSSECKRYENSGIMQKCTGKVKP